MTGLSNSNSTDFLNLGPTHLTNKTSSLFCWSCLKSLAIPSLSFSHLSFSTLIYAMIGFSHHWIWILAGFSHHFNEFVSLLFECTPKDISASPPKTCVIHFSVLSRLLCTVVISASYVARLKYSECLTLALAIFHFLRYKPFQVNLDLGLNEGARTFGAQKFMLPGKGKLWGLWVQGGCDYGL